VKWTGNAGVEWRAEAWNRKAKLGRNGKAGMVRPRADETGREWQEVKSTASRAEQRHGRSGDVREIFLQYAKHGAMTKEELASVLKIKPEAVRRLAKAGKIPRIEGLRFVRFDPMAMIEAFCKEPDPKDKARSLTIERHKTSAKSNGGFRKCL
jgi:hypothetical protein